MISADLRHDDGDRLRIFVLQEAGEGRVVDLAQLLPDITARRSADILHDEGDFFVVEDAY